MLESMDSSSPVLGGTGAPVEEEHKRTSSLDLSDLDALLQRTR